ncbi:MAG: serine/threonine protein kinase [Myxococcales bacterium]|nr:serine/threonine protein kinase [Myxococcales bacterium]MCB9583588.1 serine/threonine protein kinase [Polyangiaceae bacterium]
MSDDEQYELCASRVGSVLGGKWHLDRLIGVGGMAAVFSATHRNGAVAAIKLLHEQFVSFDQARDRFQREAYIGNKVVHSGVVKVLDDDVTAEGQPYLVMELLHGQSVRERAAENGGQLGLREALCIARDTLSVLQAAHSVEIVHRDIKPENLFLTNEGELKVLDFGIARLLEGTEATSHTRTGMLMGTPDFMAPEQALGRWSQVDARTDLWAVGAVVFSLLTGRPVHKASTANEVLVLAASQRAPSLARFSDAPVDVIALVDRALDYDSSRRFQSAGEMHMEVCATLGALAEDASPRARHTVRPPVAGVAPTMAAPRERRPTPRTVPPPARGSVAPPPRGSAFPPPLDLEEGDASLAPLTETFRLLERALFGARQYGSTHPEALRRLDTAFAQCELALAQSDDELLWEVTPYAFVARGSVLWEPRQPFDRIPYQLFADGVRMLGLVSGLSKDEFGRLILLLTQDRQGLPSEDDSVTWLWDAGFDHVVYQAFDNFVAGDAESYDDFGSETDAVLALANFDSSFQLEDCWSEHRGSGADASTREQRLARLLALDDEHSAEAEARAERIRKQRARMDVQSGSVDEGSVAALREQLEADVALDERFVVAVAVAFNQAALQGTLDTVTVPLSAGLDALAADAPDAALSLLSRLALAFRELKDPAEAAELHSELVRQTLTATALGHLLHAAIADPDPARVTAVHTLTGALTEQHVPVIAEALPRVFAGDLKDALIAGLVRLGRGHEAEIGAMFATADVALALALLRVLGSIESPEARDAMALAVQSPHAIVRIEALGHIEGARGERLRVELRALLEDVDPEVRVAALRAIQAHVIRAAGPFLVLRIKSDDFDKLPEEERRMLLATLATLAPQRAEAVCVELLQESRVVSTGAHEDTRALAAEQLGAIAETQEALAALEAASKGRFRNSQRVRQSAGIAHNQVEIRLSQPPAARGRSS